MISIFRAAGVLTAIFICSHANAQDRPTVLLTPADPLRWDAAGDIGWFGANKEEIAPEWNDWADAASFGASAGYYLTPHLKIEVGVQTTTTGDVESQQFIQVGGPFPVYRSRRHFVRSTTLSTGLTYQFLENSWFHPFLGIGIEGLRERARIEWEPQFVPLPGGRPGTLVPPEPTEFITTYAARGFATAGFKWYLSERAFIRTALRSSFSQDRAESVEWRAGIGFDF